MRDHVLEGLLHGRGDFDGGFAPDLGTWILSFTTTGRIGLTTLATLISLLFTQQKGLFCSSCPSFSLLFPAQLCQKLLLLLRHAFLLHFPMILLKPLVVLCLLLLLISFQLLNLIVSTNYEPTIPSIFHAFSSLILLFKQTVWRSRLRLCGKFAFSLGFIPIKLLLVTDVTQGLDQILVIKICRWFAWLELAFWPHAWGPSCCKIRHGPGGM